MPKLHITQTRSESGHALVMRRTLKALGLKGYQRSVEHEDTPQIRGMIRRVNHLVSVEAPTDRPAPSPRPKSEKRISDSQHASDIAPREGKAS